MTDELDRQLNEILNKMQVEEYGIISVPNTIIAIKAIIDRECNKARIDEIKRYREAMTFAHITPSIYAAERIPELLSEEQL